MKCSVWTYRFSRSLTKQKIGILYLHDEFSKLIKGQVINDKKKETIVIGIENKWILGGGGGPGHPSKGFFSGIMVTILFKPI